MGRLYRRHKAGVWYGDYLRADGKRIQRSLRTKDKAVARDRLKFAELGEAAPVSRRKQRLMDAIGEMIDSLHEHSESTREMYREKGRRLLKTLGNPAIRDITFNVLNSYIAKRRSKDPEHGNAKAHTIQKELITVRRALKHAVRAGNLSQLPAWPEFSPRYVPRNVWLTVDQFEAMCEGLGSGNRILWASLATLAGLRAGEIDRLTWSMVSLAQGELALPSGQRIPTYGWLTVPGTKTEKSARRVPIMAALYSRLEDALNVASLNDEVDGLVARPWSNCRRDLHVACKAAGVSLVSPNDLRRTFASWLVQNGADLLTVAALLGHSSTRMVEQVYGKLSATNLETAIARLPVTHGVTDSCLLPPTQDHSEDNQR